MRADWEVTLRFRPLRVLRNLVVGVVALVVLACPLWMGNAADIKREPTVAELSRKTAFRVVSDILASRMEYLDPARRAQLVNTILDESLACNLDPLFVLAVGDVESKLDHEAVSPTGARGLFQLIPSTWKAEVARRHLGRLEKFNVAHNAKVGVGYLCHLTESFRRPDSLLLAYNQGPSVAHSVIKGERPPTEEGAAYVPRVWAAYKRFLTRLRLPTDLKSMRRLARAPRLTIYVPVLGRRDHSVKPFSNQKPMMASRSP